MATHLFGPDTCDNCGRTLPKHPLDDFGLGLLTMGKRFCSNGCKREYERRGGGGGGGGLINGVGALLGGVGTVLTVAAKGADAVVSGVANGIKEANRQQAIKNAENARIAQKQASQNALIAQKQTTENTRITQEQKVNKHVGKTKVAQKQQAHNALIAQKQQPAKNTQCAPAASKKKSQTAAVQSKADEFIFCSDCGAKNPFGDMFCSDCGSKLDY